MHHPSTRLGRARLLLTAPLAVIAIVASACGAADDADGSGSESTTTETEAQSIISLSPTTTEMLYAVGAGDRVVAVDDRSDYPVDAPVTDLSGYTPNLEAILGYGPDLVVLTDDSGDIVSGLERSGVEVLLLPAAENLEDTYTQIEQVGAATGNIGDAAEVVSRMQTEIAQILSGLPVRDTPLTYFHELDDTFYTVTDETYVGEVYSLFGLTSIATGDTTYPQLSEEMILESDPDLVFLADAQCCGVTTDSVSERPGWSGLTAVREGRVHIVDEDLSSRWGPRVVDFIREVAALVAAIPVGDVPVDQVPAGQVPASAQPTS